MGIVVIGTSLIFLAYLSFVITIFDPYKIYRNAKRKYNNFRLRRSRTHNRKL